MPQSHKLKKSGTMQQATKEGENYLERSWGLAKLNTIKNLSGIASSSQPETPIVAAAENSDQAVESEPKTKRAKLSKHSTMLATAKESQTLLKNTNIDVDAKTRGQAQEISNLIRKTPPRLSKNATMLATAKESETILKSSKIDQDAKTRNQSKAINAIKEAKSVNNTPKLKKHGTMTATTKEALDFMTRQPLGNSRKQKATKKPLLKKAGTMERTAKEGKAFVKRLGK